MLHPREDLIAPWAVRCVSMVVEVLLLDVPSPNLGYTIAPVLVGNSLYPDDLWDLRLVYGPWGRADIFDGLD